MVPSRNKLSQMVLPSLSSNTDDEPPEIIAYMTIGLRRILLLPLQSFATCANDLIGWLVQSSKSTLENNGKQLQWTLSQAFHHLLLVWLQLEDVCEKRGICLASTPHSAPTENDGGDEYADLSLGLLPLIRKSYQDNPHQHSLFLFPLLLWNSKDILKTSRG
jgi:hypothetical protein